MPENYGFNRNSPIIGATGVEWYPNWNDFNIASNSLIDVLGNSGKPYWSGSNDDGSVANNCGGWEIRNNSHKGVIGSIHGTYKDINSIEVNCKNSCYGNTCIPQTSSLTCACKMH